MTEAREHTEAEMEAILGPKEFEIVKGIPDKRGGVAGQRYPFDKLRPEEGFKVAVKDNEKPETVRSRLLNAATVWSTKNNKKYSWVTRSLNEDGVKVVGIYRAK